LTYDADALNAIAGALHTDRRIFHLWGAPIRPYEPSLAGCHRPIEIAVLWSHQQPARRRIGFPSWSSIGWEGQISWLGTFKPSEQDSICIRHAKAGDLFLHQFPVRVLTNMDSADISQYLEITASSASFAVANSSQIMFSTDQAPKFPKDCMVVSLPWRHNTLVFFRPHWDIASFELESGTHLKGIRLRSKYVDFWGKDFEVVLLVVPHDDHYERVGIFKLPVSHQALFGQHRETDKVTQLDSYVVCDTDLQQQTLEEVDKICRSDTDLISYFYSPTERYWEERFVRETIVLG